MTNTNGYNGDDLIAELDELADVPTDVLGAWVAERGRCLWETTIGKAPAWVEDPVTDRELAAQLCAGCPVRTECLLFELRVGGPESVGVWGGLNEDDRNTLHAMWSRFGTPSDVDVTIGDAGLGRNGGEQA